MITLLGRVLWCLIWLLSFHLYLLKLSSPEILLSSLSYMLNHFYSILFFACLFKPLLFLYVLRFFFFSFFTVSWMIGLGISSVEFLWGPGWNCSPAYCLRGLPTWDHFKFNDHSRFSNLIGSKFWEWESTWRSACVINAQGKFSILLSSTRIEFKMQVSCLPLSNKLNFLWEFWDSGFMQISLLE